MLNYTYLVSWSWEKTFPGGGGGGWVVGSAGNKANSAQLELELWLSLAKDTRPKIYEIYQTQDLPGPRHTSYISTGHKTYQPTTYHKQDPVVYAFQFFTTLARLLLIVPIESPDMNLLVYVMWCKSHPLLACVVRFFISLLVCFSGLRPLLVHFRIFEISILHKIKTTFLARACGVPAVVVRASSFGCHRSGGRLLTMT